MAWRYENPGYRELLVVPGHTVKCDATKSKTGYAFWQNYQSKSFDIPSTKEIWIKFDVYTTSGTSNRWRVYNYKDGSPYNGLTLYDGNINLFVYSKNDGYTAQYTPDNFTGLHTIILHMLSGTSDGIIDFYFDGKKATSVTGHNVNDGNAFKDIYMESDGSDILFSNVIISDTELTVDDTCDLSNKQWIQPVLDKFGNFGIDEFSIRATVTPSTVYKAFDATNTSYGTSKGVYFSIAKNVEIKHIRFMFFPNKNTSFYNWCLSYSDDDKTYTLCQKVARDTSSYYLTFTDVPYHKYYFISLQDKDGNVVENAVFDGVVIDAIESDTEKFILLDTHRNVSNATTQQSDTARHLAESIVTPHDTARALAVSAVHHTDTRRILSAAINPSADTVRYVSCDTVVNADTVRLLAENIDVDMVADTARNLYRAASMLDDTTRKISNVESVNADIKRTVTADAIDTLDTVRTLTHTAGLTADTVRDVVKYIDVDADTARITNSSTITLHADTSRQLANDTAVSVDTVRDVSLTLALSIDLLRDTGKISFDADAVRDVYLSQIDVSEDTIRRLPYLIDNKMIQSVTLTIAEHTISDSMDIRLVGDYLPKDSIKGIFLDYPYAMMVLSTARDKDGIIQNINAVNDFYKFNFSKTRYFAYDESGNRLKASQFISRIADKLGYKASVLIDDYEPEMKLNGNGYEYRDDSSLTYGKELRYESYPNMLTQIFGWTQELPWRQVNVFAHNGVLYAIQRGKEPNTVDLSERKITRPNIERTLFSQDAEFYEFEYLTPGSSYISGHTGGERYQKFVHNLLNGSINTQYDSYGNITHTVGKMTGEDGEELTSYTDYTYEYDAEGNILSTITDVTVYDSQNEVVDRYSSGSVDAGNRNSAYMMTNGDSMIAGTTAGHPTNKPFADESFTWATTPTKFYFCKVDAYGNRSKKFVLHDMPEKPFPVGNEKNLVDFCTGYNSSYHKIKSLFDELLAYNQKVQETLTFDIVDPILGGNLNDIHVIDMRDKIKLNDAIYYLERNVVTLTKNSLRQSLTVVRWF